MGAPKKFRAAKASDQPTLLSGDNPQIPKGEGDGPVQAYIAAIPGWKRNLASRIDAAVVRALPDVRKAVKYNSPLYGMDGATWFLSLHCFTRYLKVAFVTGKHLKPMPPGTSKTPQARYLDIREGDAFDEVQFAAWVTQASKLPGEKL